jgi:outer membrane protein OmpA-like peptidoglycan-associated protein
MSETIGRQTASYRQGLVLGLTMAEIMILLVFCMLIAVGVALANQHARLDDAMLRLRQLQAAAAADKAMVETIKSNARLAELLDKAAGAASQLEINEFWRKLVESNDIVVSMERRGVSRVALKEESNDLAKLHRLLIEGIDPGKIARAVAVASAIDQADPARTVASLTPQQVAALIEKGVAASNQGSESEPGGRHNWPPIINLSEADGYYFATGSADLTPDFALALRTVVVARLLQIAEAFDADVIEVIGHTDEQPVSNHASNLDRNLPAVTLGLNSPGPLQWADNAGLGLARALAVVKVLDADPRLRTFRVLPLSGAQLIDTDGRLTHWDAKGDVRERRRIEIRMRKSG